MTVAARGGARARRAQVLSPVIDLARDPRWGRTEETYGEDPYLVLAAGRGRHPRLSGAEPPLRHGQGLRHGQALRRPRPARGRASTPRPTAFASALLRDELLFPFEAAVKETPRHGRDAVLQRDGRRALARQPLAARPTCCARSGASTGMVVSDYYAIEQLVSRHGVAADLADAARQALEAGVDVELPDMAGLSEAGRRREGGPPRRGGLDRAVARMLRAKFLAGLFERSVRRSPTGRSRSATRPSTRRSRWRRRGGSIVLLKNDGGLLPLDRSEIKTLAVIGPNAEGRRLGGYSERSRPRRQTSSTASSRRPGTGLRSRLRRRHADHRAARELDRRQGRRSAIPRRTASASRRRSRSRARPTWPCS